MAGVIVVSCNVGGLFQTEIVDAETYPGVSEAEEQQMRDWVETYLSPVRDAPQLPALISMHVQELGGLIPPSSPAIGIAAIPPPPPPSSAPINTASRDLNCCATHGRPQGAKRAGVGRRGWQHQSLGQGDQRRGSSLVSGQRAPSLVLQGGLQPRGPLRQGHRQKNKNEREYNPPPPKPPATPWGVDRRLPLLGTRIAIRVPPQASWLHHALPVPTVGVRKSEPGGPEHLDRGCVGPQTQQRCFAVGR